MPDRWIPILGYEIGYMEGAYHIFKRGGNFYNGNIQEAW